MPLTDSDDDMLQPLPTPGSTHHPIRPVDDEVHALAREIDEQQRALANAISAQQQRYIAHAQSPLQNLGTFANEVAAAARLAILQGEFKSAAPLYKLASDALGFSRENHLHVHTGPNARLAALTDEQLQAMLASPVEAALSNA